MKKVAIMARVSSDEQAKGYSLDDQKQRLIDYCNRHQYEIVYTIKEDHSAKSFDRPEWTIWLSKIRDEEIEVDEILFTSWDRFSRDLVGALNMITLLRDKFKISPQAIEQPIDYNIPENLFMLAIYLANPDVDNQRRSIKVKGGIRQALKQGRWPKKPVFGYITERDSQGKSGLVPDPEKAHYVPYIFEQIIEGKSQVEIRDELKKKGINISRNNMCNILKREVYAGKIYIPADDKEPARVIDGIHEPLITEATYLEVQQILKGKRKARGKSTPKYTKMRNDFHLRGVLKCNHCNELMTASFSRGKLGKKYGYYHCNHCKGQREPVGKVHSSVQHLLEDISIKPEVLELYREFLKDELNLSKKDQTNSLSGLKKQLKLLTERIEKSQELMLDGKLEPDEYLQIKAKYSSQINEIREKMEQLTSQPKEIEQVIDSGLNLLAKLPTTYEQASVRLKQKILGSIFSEQLSFDGEKCRTPKQNPVLELISSYDQGSNKKKKGQPHSKKKLSLEAERGGFEPPIPLRV